MSLTIGIDVGGTKIAGGVVDEQGDILVETVRESPADDQAALQDAIADLVTELRATHDVAAVGVGAAAHVAADRSTVLFAPNLAWRDLPLGESLARRTGLPVDVENDANAAAWGEYRFGAGRGVEHLLLTTIGTGVGGGVVVGGRLLRGAHGIAAEVGHVRVVPGGRRCGCGQLGCLETYASGSALERDTRALAGDTEEAHALLERAGGDPESIDGPMITEAAEAGDAFAVARLADMGTWLGQGLASLAAVLDPGVILLGGGVAAAGPLLLDPVRAAFVTHLTGAGHRPEAEIRTAELGNRAGLVGAADLARERI